MATTFCGRTSWRVSGKVAGAASPSLRRSTTVGHARLPSSIEVSARGGDSRRTICFAAGLSATPIDLRATPFAESGDAARRRGARQTCRSLKTGIVGLPNVGKSTLFNALVEGSQAQAANFPFCTIEPNVGTVPVPDERLHELSELSKSKSTVSTTIEFVDIAGLVAGASKGEGLGNKFLSHIREVDAIVHVVRCFEDTDVVHVDGSVDPLRDTDVIETELALADLAQIERRFETLKKKKGKKAGDQGDPEAEKKVLESIMAAVEQGVPARKADVEAEDFDLVKGLGLLTMKPVIYAANVAEDDLMDEAASNPHAQALRKKAEDENARFVLVSAKMEEELVELSGEDKQEFLEGFGIKQTGLQALIKVAYDMLGLRTYFTSGEKETRAWTIVSGMTAPDAAGVIHSDFTKGFIRAETIAYDDFVKTGSQSAAKEKGLLRSEGKDYVVKEGDVILFRFNV